MTWYVQQGDVILFKTDLKEVPNNAVKTKLLHKGDNHEHTFKFPVETWDNFFYLPKSNSLLHFEHKEIKVPSGIYEKKIVVEYDHFLEESRQVID